MSGLCRERQHSNRRSFLHSLALTLTKAPDAFAWVVERSFPSNAITELNNECGGVIGLGGDIAQRPLALSARESANPDELGAHARTNRDLDLV